LSGLIVLAESLSVDDPGCVKTLSSL